MSNPSISRSCQAVLKKVASILLFSSVRRDSRCAAYQVSSWQKTCQLNGSHNRQTYMDRMDPYGYCLDILEQSIELSCCSMPEARQLFAWYCASSNSKVQTSRLRENPFPRPERSCFMSLKQCVNILSHIMSHLFYNSWSHHSKSSRHAQFLIVVQCIWYLPANCLLMNVKSHFPNPNCV